MKRRTTIELDDDLLAEAREVLGTRGIRATVETALTEVVHAERRKRLSERLATLDGLDREALLEARRWRKR